MMAVEYNELTKKLLSEGYTAENYPKEIVRIGGNSCCFEKNNPLDNFYGGFEYIRIYAEKITYQTGCGLFVKGKNVLSDMGYMGVNWCHENFNPVVRCPFDKANCPHNDERLHGMRGGGLCIQCWCVCHRTKKTYDYENSFEKEEELRRQEKERKYKEYSDAHNGRVCQNHMYYDERTRSWKQIYKPSRCANICYSKDGYCPILGNKLNKKRGNVYYDVKESGIIHQKEAQQSLLDGERWTNIRKGIRYFKKPCSMDICEAFVKISSDEIKRNYDVNHSFEHMLDKSWQVEILNIRAESKPSRDLMQDLTDIKAGINISFEPDIEKHQKEIKKKRREELKQKRIEKLEKKIMEVGYENLEEFSVDKVHAYKWLTSERREELEQLRQQKIKEEQNKPIQLTLFDMQQFVE